MMMTGIKCAPSNLRPRPKRPKSMTVCVAALCHGGKDAVGTYDCMITYGGLQFEAPEQKAIPVDKGTLVLIAGDGDLQTEILTRLKTSIADRKLSEPEKEISVAEVARLYQDAYVATWQDKAERIVLAKEGLTYKSYVEKQSTLNAQTCETISAKLALFQLPQVASIVVGVDGGGAHLYQFSYNDELGDYDLVCRDSTGYASIGSGARLAEAVFIGHKFTPDTALTDALFTCYEAKRKAELADGVGKQTRIFKIVPEELEFLWKQPTFNRLITDTYDRMVKSIEEANKDAREHISTEVSNVIEEIQKRIAATKEKRLAEKKGKANTANNPKQLRGSSKGSKRQNMRTNPKP